MSLTLNVNYFDIKLSLTHYTNVLNIKYNLIIYNLNINFDFDFYKYK